LRLCPHTATAVPSHQVARQSVAELGGGYTRSHKAAVARSDTADRLLLVARDVAFYQPLRNDIGANESWGTCGKFDSAIDAP